jgi:UDP-N-acetylglucosamine acyltransferase
MSIHPSALVDASVVLAPNVTVGPFAVIEPDVEIGAGCDVRAHAVVKRFTTIGAGCVIHEHAVLGGEPQDISFKGGRSGVRVGERTQLREGVTIHRSTRVGGETTVGSDCLLMAYVHLGHDCAVGDGVIVANNTAFGGHVTIERKAFVSGQVAVHQFCRIGRLAMVGASAKVVQDCLPFVITDGHPARARGLNVVGLRRAGFGASELRVLKEAYRLLLRSSLPLEEALQRLAASGDPLVEELVTFVRGSRRSFCRSRPDSGEV